MLFVISPRRLLTELGATATATAAFATTAVATTAVATAAVATTVATAAFAATAVATAAVATAACTTAACPRPRRSSMCEAEGAHHTHRMTLKWVRAVPASVLSCIVNVMYSILAALGMSGSSGMRLVRVNPPRKIYKSSTRDVTIFTRVAERGRPRVESGWVWTGAVVMVGPLQVGQSTIYTFNKSLHGRRYGRTVRVPGADMKEIDFFQPRNGRLRGGGYHFPGLICCL